LSARYDESGDMTPERKAEVAKELGLADVPRPRYDDLPEVHDLPTVREKWNFMKAVALVDPLASAAFMNYLPSRLVVDQSINPREYRQGWSWCTHVRTDKPIPVNRKITAATGIGHGRNEKNWYGWLAQWVLRVYTELNARSVSPCLVWRTRGERKRGRYVIVPVLGVIFKLDRTPPDGRRIEDMVNQMGLLHPSALGGENRVQPVATVSLEGEGEPVRDSITADAKLAPEKAGATLKLES